MQRLLTTREVAELLGLHPSTIRQWCDRGVLLHVRIGRNRRIPADAVERLMAKLEDSERKGKQDE